MSRVLYRSVFVVAVFAAGLAIVQCSSSKSDGDGDTGAAGDGGQQVSCKADVDCNAKAGESCVSGKCVKVECKANIDCTNAAKACCNITTYQCAACGAPDGGTDAGDTDGPKLCTSKAECKPDKWCDNGAGGSGACLPMAACASDAQCAEGFICNAFNTVCECSTDDNCKDWPDGKTVCDPATKQCSTPVVVVCNPPCDDNCRECVGQTCEFKAGMVCCTDNDCITPPYLSCDPNTRTCVEVKVCTDACTTDQECATWCKDKTFVCDLTTSTCAAMTCTADADCTAICTPDAATCPAGTCVCTPPAGAICDDCSIDKTICTNAGLTCGFATKKCTQKCTTSAECADAAGQLYVCQELFGGYSMCNCNTPTCCTTPCTAPDVCDEGGTCACITPSACSPACTAPQVCDETAGVCTNCNPPCVAPDTCDEVNSVCLGVDGGTPDAGEVDAGEIDAGEVDAGEADAGTPDLDAGTPDAGEVDAEVPDGG